MNAFQAQIRSLVALFDKMNIQYVIIGGFAVSIYGEPRITLDIDVNINLGKDKIDHLLTEGKKLGFSVMNKGAKSFMNKTGIVPLIFKKGKIKGIVDIIIAENPIEFASIKRGRMKKIGNVMARIISPEDLVIHKIASTRPRDREDLRGILIRQKGKLDAAYIKSVLKRIDKIDANLRLVQDFTILLKEADSPGKSGPFSAL